jgi:hypothetical protein
VLVTPDACPIATLLGERAPAVRIVSAPPGSGQADMRRRGVAAGSTDIILFRGAEQLRSADSRGALVDWLDWLAAAARLGASELARRRWTSGAEPRLSVIVPARDAATFLAESLAALGATDVPRAEWELVVVDDGSCDSTTETAACHADVLVRLRQRSLGPAYARNRGFELSRGGIVAFVDADVRVHPDTLSRIAADLRPNLATSAVIGSYDAAPSAPGLVSQYRNLLRHFVHQRRAGEISAFWASCGGIRREAFAAVGMFDEWHFARPQVEDLELGTRLVRGGHRIVLDPKLQVSHLKRWTLGQMLVTDLRDRGALWGRLRGCTMSTALLGVRTEEMASTMLIGLALVTMLGAVATGAALWSAAAVAAFLLVLLLNRALYAFFARSRGIPFALAVVPLHLASQCLNGAALLAGRALRELVGEPRPPATVQAYAELGVRRWPPVPSPLREPPDGERVESSGPERVGAARGPTVLEVGINSKLGG